MINIIHTITESWGSIKNCLTDKLVGCYAPIHAYRTYVQILKKEKQKTVAFIGDASVRIQSYSKAFVPLLNLQINLHVSIHP